MAVPFENRNFHKEMLKLAGQLQKKEKYQDYYYIAVVHLAVSNCIEVYRSILWLQYFIIIRIYQVMRI